MFDAAPISSRDFHGILSAEAVFSDAGLCPLQFRSRFGEIEPIVHNSHDRANNFIFADSLPRETAIVAGICRTG